MRGLIVAIVALFAVMAFTPASQASPLIPGSGITMAAPQSGATQVWWRWHRWHRWHRCWRCW
jgi:hypothetical protein